MRYRYSKDIVYNNFPWPSPTEKQKKKIEETAQAILNARAKFPDSSLADLYDPLLMPDELKEAHKANDRAVLKVYDLKSSHSEAAIVAKLFKLYETRIEELEKEEKETAAGKAAGKKRTKKTKTEVTES
jgi:hypothetical protein